MSTLVSSAVGSGSKKFAPKAVRRPRRALATAAATQDATITAAASLIPAPSDEPPQQSHAPQAADNNGPESAAAEANVLAPPTPAACQAFPEQQLAETTQPPVARARSPVQRRVRFSEDRRGWPAEERRTLVERSPPHHEQPAQSQAVAEVEPTSSGTVIASDDNSVQKDSREATFENVSASDPTTAPAELAPPESPVQRIQPPEETSLAPLSPGPTQPTQLAVSGLQELSVPADGGSVSPLSSVPTSPVASPIHRESPVAPAAAAKRKRNAITNLKRQPAQKKAKNAGPPKKRSSARSNAFVQAEVNAEAEPSSVGAQNVNADSAVAPTRKRKPRNQVVVADIAPAGENGAVRSDAVNPPKSKHGGRRKRPVSATTVNEETPEPDNRGNLEEEEEGAALQTRQPRRRRRRTEEQASDEDPELHKIDPNTVAMVDLAHDTGFGKISERGREIAKIDWDEVARKRREQTDIDYQRALRIQAAKETGVELSEGPTPAANAEVDGAVSSIDPTHAEAAANATTAQPTTGGVGLRIVHGQIVEDEQTLVIDRAAAEEAANADQEIEESNDLTVRVNNSTWMNQNRREEIDRVPPWRAKSDPWSEEETERFYDALRMFGTDFFIISKMFAPKTRRQIKLKFVREERFDLKRINDVLTGRATMPIDLDHYADAIGADVERFHKYESLDDAQKKLGAEQQQKADEIRERIAELKDEARRKEAHEASHGKDRAARAAQRPKKPWRKRVGTATFGGRPGVEEVGEA